MHEEDRERGKTNIGHFVLAIGAGPPVRQVRTAVAQRPDELFKVLHMVIDSEICRFGNPKKSLKSTKLELLVDQDGKPVVAKRFLGKPTIVHFGFTHCPVVCPTTLNEVANLMQALGDDANRINFVFATVDPERDTADVLKEYIGNFDTRIIGLTGREAAIKAFAKSLNTTFAKRPSKSGAGYDMDHAIFAFLRDRDWKSAGTLYMGDGAQLALIKKKLSKLLAKRES